MSYQEPAEEPSQSRPATPRMLGVLGGPEKSRPGIRFLTDFGDLMFGL